MTESNIFLFLSDYGLIFMFVIVFMEYLNLPGFPSGVIMPAVGVWIVYTGKSFIFTFVLSIIAGLLGSLILYYVGRFGGDTILVKIEEKHPKMQEKILDIKTKLLNKAKTTVFISKLIPVARTLVGFPAGAIKMNVISYLVFSSFGIAIWNAVLILSGCVVGHFLFN